MAYKVIILYRLYMPSYFLGTFTEYPFLKDVCIYIVLIYRYIIVVLSKSVSINILFVLK